MAASAPIVLTVRDRLEPLPAMLLLLICASLLLTACDRKSLNLIPRNGVILAFGDSLTEGRGVSTSQSYPTVLAQLSGRRVVNAGVSGETTTDGLARLPDLLDDVRPQLVVLMHGGNDILRNLDMTQAQRNLAGMIKLIRARGIELMLIGVPEKRLFSDSAPIYQALADEYKLVFIDDLIGGLMRSPSKKSDAVHFNEAGYRDIAQAVFDRLRGAGAL